MKVTRLDLDGAGSPAALVAAILKVEPDLPIPVPIEDLCEQLDIISIGELETAGFEAALLTDRVKSHGAILVAQGRSRQRRRFSIGHELGHFLIPTHRPPPDAPFLCSADQLALLDGKDRNRRRRWEVEANHFAATLLMPPPILRAELHAAPYPEVGDIVRLAAMFDVSKEALARAYVDCSRKAVAIIAVRAGLVHRIYRNDLTFPWITTAPGQPVPAGSNFHASGLLAPGDASRIEGCDPETWLDERGAGKVMMMTEQMLGQQRGYALILLHAELDDDF